MEDDGLSNSDPSADSHSSADGDIGTQLDSERKKIHLHFCHLHIFMKGFSVSGTLSFICIYCVKLSRDSYHSSGVYVGGRMNIDITCRNERKYEKC